MLVGVAVRGLLSQNVRSAWKCLTYMAESKSGAHATFWFKVRGSLLAAKGWIDRELSGQVRDIGPCLPGFEQTPTQLQAFFFRWACQ